MSPNNSLTLKSQNSSSLQNPSASAQLSEAFFTEISVKVDGILVHIELARAEGESQILVSLRADTSIMSRRDTLEKKLRALYPHNTFEFIFFVSDTKPVPLNGILIRPEKRRPTVER